MIPTRLKWQKKIFEEISRSKGKSPELLNKLILLCLNDNVPFDKKHSLHNRDIEEFLERKIDFTRKYIANFDKFKSADDSDEIKAISAAVIGNKTTANKRLNFVSLPYYKKTT